MEHSSRTLHFAEILKAGVPLLADCPEAPAYSKGFGPVWAGAWFSGGLGFGGLVPRRV